MKRVRKRSIAVMLALTASLAVATPASAEYIAYIYQDGPNVVATGSGSLDLAGLSFLFNARQIPVVNPSLAALGLGGPGIEPIYLATSGPTSFGSGG